MLCRDQQRSHSGGGGVGGVVAGRDVGKDQPFASTSDVPSLWSFYSNGRGEPSLGSDPQSAWSSGENTPNYATSSCNFQTQQMLGRMKAVSNGSGRSGERGAVSQVKGEGTACAKGLYREGRREETGQTKGAGLCTGAGGSFWKRLEGLPRAGLGCAGPCEPH